MNKGDQGTKNYNSKEVLLKTTKRDVTPCRSASYAVDSAPDPQRVNPPRSVDKPEPAPAHNSSAAPRP
jgi:hypothetical protein